MNPEKLYLALRLLAGHVQCLFFNKIEDVLTELKFFLEDVQGLFEWNELDTLFEAWFDKVYLQRQFSERSEEILGYMLQRVSSFPFEDSLIKVASQIWSKAPENGDINRLPTLVARLEEAIGYTRTFFISICSGIRRHTSFSTPAHTAIR